MVDYYDANAVANESAMVGEPVDMRPVCGCGRPLKWGQAYCPICEKVIDQAMKKAVRLIMKYNEFTQEDAIDAACYWIENENYI